MLDIRSLAEAKRIMRDIWVDKSGIQIMGSKSLSFLIKVNNLSNICANILKQEMLSLGGDVAVSRDALTGKTKKTDCLLMGNLSQFNRLNSKLRNQTFGLNSLSKDMSSVLENYQREKFLLDLGRYKLNLGRKTKIMGIINLTPDSFSQDGVYANLKIRPKNPKLIDQIVERAEQMVKEGADIIDLGGQSSRPGARPISIREEIRRTIPVIKKITKRIKLPVSIDTYRPEVARAALDQGASLINDITGLRNSKMIKLISRHRCGVIIMHMQGMPKNMQRDPHYHSLIDEIIDYLRKAMERAEHAGIDRQRIVVDPGLGFGKNFKHNLLIIRNLREFKVLGRPILVGTSRKSFIGKILNLPPQERILGTVSSCLLAVQNGANIIRVHDVRELKEAMKVSDAINN